jgi:hypothetical protein
LRSGLRQSRRSPAELLPPGATAPGRAFERSDSTRLSDGFVGGWPHLGGASPARCTECAARRVAVAHGCASRRGLAAHETCAAAAPRHPHVVRHRGAVARLAVPSHKAVRNRSHTRVRSRCAPPARGGASLEPARSTRLVWHASSMRIGRGARACSPSSRAGRRHGLLVRRVSGFAGRLRRRASGGHPLTSREVSRDQSGVVARCLVRRVFGGGAGVPMAGRLELAAWIWPRRARSAEPQRPRLTGRA